MASSEPSWEALRSPSTFSKLVFIRYERPRCHRVCSTRCYSGGAAEGRASCMFRGILHASKQQDMSYVGQANRGCEVEAIQSC